MKRSGKGLGFCQIGNAGKCANVFIYCRSGIFSGHLNIANIAGGVHTPKLNHAIFK